MTGSEDSCPIDFHREFIKQDQSFLGIALIPPRGSSLECFTNDAPSLSGRKLFQAGWSALRVKDSTRLLTQAEVEQIASAGREPIVGRNYAIDEPHFRILQPDYQIFVPRNEPAAAISNALADARVAVISLVGIGGIGKTALATWCVLQAYQSKNFNFIVSVTAKDRELTASGIRSLRSELTSFESLLDATLDVLGFRDLKPLNIQDKEAEIRGFLRDSGGLFLVDNLETVDDARIIKFLDDLPIGVKALITSRRTTVRKLVCPIDLNGLNQEELIQFVDSLSRDPRFSYISKLNVNEKLRVGNACDRIPLAIRWIFSRAHSAAEAITNADNLTTIPRHGEELLEFSFRRVFEGMSTAEKSVLEVLSLFQTPLPTEALLIGCGISQVALEDALESLSQDVLVQRQFDPDTNDYAFSIKAIPRSFVLSELAKNEKAGDSIRGRLTNWYEARDISDPETRLAVRELRQGRVSPELGLIDLAKAAERSGELDNAARLYEQALARVPTSWRAAREYAEFKRHLRHDRTGALQMYERAAANAPRRGSDRAVIFREFGFLLRESGEANATDQALEKFDIAFRETPNDPITLYGLASMFERKGHYLKVVEYLEPLKSHPNPKTRERCLPLLLKAYERQNEMLKAAELREFIMNR